MRLFSNKVVNAVLSLVIATAGTLVVGLSGSANAIACFQYDPNGFPTSQTPVFNNICGITSTLSSTQGSYPLGDEPNFVRIRPNTSGSPLGANNPPLVNSLDSACNAGDQFDIWTYVHNDAEPQFNDNGNGTGVAKDVMLKTVANGINTTGSSFSFSSTISASNAASVTDGTTLNCNGKQVKLTLVHDSVRYNTDLSQTSFNSLPDSAVNGTTELGNPNFGNGKVFGCWEFRTVVVYRVTVQEVPKEQPSTGVCKDIDFSSDKRTVTVTVNGKVDNAQILAYKIDWGDNSTPSNKQSDTHKYSDSQTSAKIVASVQVKLANGEIKWVTADTCTKLISFITTNTPPSSPPKQLVNTGPEDVVGIFTGTSLVGAFLHRKWSLRKLNR